MIEVLTTVFVASAVGSLHCLGMCGGFVAFYAGAGPLGERAGSGHLLHTAYNGGRLATYTVLGAAAGVLGAGLDLAEGAAGVERIAALVAGTLIIVGGSLLLAQALGARWATLPRPSLLQGWLTRTLSQLRNQNPVARALALGASSTLLPCGWLYGFAVTAAGTGHPLSGAVVMAVFWLGTLPAMLFAGYGLNTAARWLGPRLGVIMPTMLILMGLLTLYRRSGGTLHGS